MAKKGQKQKKYSLAFKELIVQKRIRDGYGINRLSRYYHISPENIVKWTRRYLAGEPLEMKRGRQPKSKEETVSDDPLIALRKENEFLKAEIAYKNELLALLEHRISVKKKTNSESSIDCDPNTP